MSDFDLACRLFLPLGALMNARGLMELILLNLGLERGLLTPTLFTIMVVMAVATTLLAVPVLDWAQRRPEAVPVTLAEDQPASAER